MQSIIINKITWFSRLKLCFDFCAILIFSVLCGTNKIIRVIVWLFCSNDFQSGKRINKYFPECDGKSISFQLCWSIQGLFFDILSGWVLICLWFNATVKAYWKQLSSLFFGFYVVFLLLFFTIQENLYMIHLFSNLFFKGGNLIN